MTTRSVPVHTGRMVALQGLVGTAAVWLAVAAFFAAHHGTHWPAALPAIPPSTPEHFAGRPGASTFEAWWGFLRLCFVVEFLVTKAWAMWRRTRIVDALGVSLIAANVGFACVYASVVASQLLAWSQPYWFREYVVGDPLVLVLVVGWILLCRLPDDPDGD